MEIQLKERTKQNGKQLNKHIYYTAARISNKQQLCTYLQSRQRNTSKEQCRATTEYNAIIYSTYTGLLSRLAPHTHIYPEPKRKGSRDFPERVVLPWRPQLRAPPAWSASSCRASLVWSARQHGRGFGETDGVFRRSLCARSWDPGLAQGPEGRRKEDWQEQQTGSKDPTSQEQNLDDQPTNDPRETAMNPPRPSLL